MSTPASRTHVPPARSSPSTAAAFRNDVAAAIDAGAEGVTIDLDAAEVLDSVLISALIGILRHARERGSAVVLRAGRRQTLDTLRVTGLDKIFVVERLPNRLVA